MSMNAALREASVGGSQDAVWGVTGIMSKDILPDDPDECRRRRRLHALRAMDRLGLLGEENLISTLAKRPAVRWLADERGARWDVLAELGRIGEPEAFEEALEWALENRPRPEQVKARLCLFGSGGLRPAEAGGAGRSPVTQRAANAPHAHRATGKEENRRS
jgi:hypothetical protein